LTGEIANRSMLRGAIWHVHSLALLRDSGTPPERKQIPGIGEWIMSRTTIPVADYKAIANFKPFKRDPLKKLAAECRTQGSITSRTRIGQHRRRRIQNWHHKPPRSGTLRRMATLPST
jgi:hypothetical protein